MNFTGLDPLELGRSVLYLGLALLLVLPVAYNRELNTSIMGLRTFPLVSIGACAYILMARMFFDTPDAQARALQGLLSGLGFIGGGAILKTEENVQGTACAASIWVTGALGAAVGFGAFELAIVLSCVNLLVLRYGRRVKQVLHDTGPDKDLLDYRRAHNPMEGPTELERFLSSQQEGGDKDSEGVFTLSREESLRKLATYQLSFHLAWAVKVVQCAVAGGAGTPIRVDLKVRETRFFFSNDTLDLDELEAAFYDPQAKLDPAGMHLLAALGALGLNLKQSFQLALPGQPSTLIWDGNKLHRVGSSKKYDCVNLAVAYPVAGTLQWVKALALSGLRNAELLRTLSKWCFTCPVPLTVDGRRLDSLQHCPTHGWTRSSFPFAILFAHPDLAPVPIAPGTFSYRPSLEGPKRRAFLMENAGDGMQGVGEEMLGQLDPVERAPLPLF